MIPQRAGVAKYFHGTDGGGRKCVGEKQHGDVNHSASSAGGSITYVQWHICHLVTSISSLYSRKRTNTFCEAGEDVMKKYVIERDLPKVGTLEREQLKAAAAKSNQALREVGTDIQWIESFVAADKTFCVYLAKDESVIHKHAELSGFPASKVTEIGKTIDPTTAG
jgi:hypothetical protein